MHMSNTRSIRELSVWQRIERGMRGRIVLCTVLAALSAHLQAAEKESMPIGPSDWLAKDRAAFSDASGMLSTPALRAWYAERSDKNSFIEAAKHNTQSPKPSEYKSISQRQAYYDWVSLAIEADPKLSHGVDDVKFFHATAMVTSRGFLGWAETPLAQLEIPITKWKLPVAGIDQPTRDLIGRINQQLFTANVDVLGKLLYHWNEPRSPLPGQPGSKLTGLEFDLQMVDLEQGLVEKIIGKGVDPAALKGINDVLKRAIALNPGMRRANDMAKLAGVSPPDFRNIAWRKAIGRAVVYDMHMKSLQEYSAAFPVPAASKPDVGAKQATESVSELAAKIRVKTPTQAEMHKLTMHERHPGPVVGTNPADHGRNGAFVGPSPAPVSPGPSPAPVRPTPPPNPYKGDDQNIGPH